MVNKIENEISTQNRKKIEALQLSQKMDPTSVRNVKQAMVVVLILQTMYYITVLLDNTRYYYYDLYHSYLSKVDFAFGISLTTILLYGMLQMFVAIHENLCWISFFIGIQILVLLFHLVTMLTANWGILFVNLVAVSIWIVYYRKLRQIRNSEFGVVIVPIGNEQVLVNDPSMEGGSQQDNSSKSVV